MEVEEEEEKSFGVNILSVAMTTAGQQIICTEIYEKASEGGGGGMEKDGEKKQHDDKLRTESRPQQWSNKHVRKRFLQLGKLVSDYTNSQRDGVWKKEYHFLMNPQ